MMWDAAPGKAVPLWLPRMPWHRGFMRLTTGWCFKVFLPKSHELSKCCGLYSTNQIAANGELHCVKTPFDKAVRFVPRQRPPRGETVFVHPCARIITPSVQNLFHVLVGEREASLSITKSGIVSTLEPSDVKVPLFLQQFQHELQPTHWIFDCFSTVSRNFLVLDVAPHEEI